MASSRATARGGGRARSRSSNGSSDRSRTSARAGPFCRWTRRSSAASWHCTRTGTTTMDRTRASEVGRLDKVYFGRAPAERAAAPPAAGTLAERRLVCSPVHADPGSARGRAAAGSQLPGGSPILARRATAPGGVTRCEKRAMVRAWKRRWTGAPIPTNSPRLAADHVTDLNRAQREDRQQV